MKVLDSGVVIAAFASWHEMHIAASYELSQNPQAVGHVLIETISVLTRLPAPHRAPLDVVAEFLELAFREEPLVLGGRELTSFVTRRLPALGISGGAVYDALIAETVRLAGGTLVTLDRRALRTYERIGCATMLLSD